jgi:hypothetical protein
LNELGFDKISENKFGLPIASSTSPKSFSTIKCGGRYGLKVDWGAMMIDPVLLNLLTASVNNVNEDLDAIGDI